MKRVNVDIKRGLRRSLSDKSGFYFCGNALWFLDASSPCNFHLFKPVILKRMFRRLSSSVLVVDWAHSE